MHNTKQPFLVTHNINPTLLYCTYITMATQTKVDTDTVLTSLTFDEKVSGVVAELRDVGSTIS